MSDWYQDAACRGKFGYETWDAAQRVAVRMNRRNRGKRRHSVGPYRCVMCDLWHVGSSSRPNRRRSSRPAPSDGTWDLRDEEGTW